MTTRIVIAVLMLCATIIWYVMYGFILMGRNMSGGDDWDDIK